MAMEVEELALEMTNGGASGRSGADPRIAMSSKAQQSEAGPLCIGWRQRNCVVGLNAMDGMGTEKDTQFEALGYTVFKFKLKGLQFAPSREYSSTTLSPPSELFQNALPSTASLPARILNSMTLPEET